MPRIFKLVSGTDEVDLINTADPGIIFRRGGAGNNSQGSDLVFTSSKLADGANLRLKRYLPIAEDYKLNLKGSSHDNVASQLQALQRILRKGDLNALTNWQQEPLYIQQQATNESNPRYSKVLAWNSIELSDYFAPPIEGDSQIDDFVITLAREPFWRGTAPGTMSDAEAVKHPDFPWFDEYAGGGGVANFDVIGAAAQEGDWGAAFTVDGSGSEIYGIDNSPDGETTFTLEFMFDRDDLAMGANEIFTMLELESPGTFDAVRINFFNTSPFDTIQIIYFNDAGSGTATNIVFDDEPLIIKVEFVASSAPGNDDGTVKMWLDAVLKVDESGIDNDTHNVTAIEIGAVTGVDAGTSGTFFIDRIRWDDSASPTTWKRTIDFEQVTAPIPNFRQSGGVLSHIYAEDVSATGFSGNLVAESSWEWFVVSGSTPAVGDAIYFGSDEPFFNLVFNFKGGQDVNINYDMEFSDGATGWVAMAGFKPNFLYLNNDYSGQMIFNWPGDPDWGKDTVNAIANKFWVRIKLTTVTDWTTSPEQINQIVYTANSPYLEFNDLQVHGDVPAQMLQRLICYNSSQSEVPQDPEANLITNVIMGQKSRGLDTFVSRLNCGGDVPTNWTANAGFDTTQPAKESSPGGNVALVDIKSSVAMLNRMKFTLDTTAQDPNDWEGNYRVYARARQNGGAVGDVALRYRYINLVAEFVGETVSMVDTDKDEIVDLGDLSMLSFGTLGDEAAGSLAFHLSIEASSESTGVTSLELYDLCLIPNDEILIHAGWSGKTKQYLQALVSLSIDSGILREGAVLYYRAAEDPEEFKPFLTWQMKSTLPMMEPRRNARLYYLYWEDNQVPGTPISNQGQALGVRSFLHERWITLRGSD